MAGRCDKGGSVVRPQQLDLVRACFLNVVLDLVNQLLDVEPNVEFVLLQGFEIAAVDKDCQVPHITTFRPGNYRGATVPVIEHKLCRAPMARTRYFNSAYPPYPNILNLIVVSVKQER